MFRMGHRWLVCLCSQSDVILSHIFRVSNRQLNLQTLLITIISVSRHALNYKVRDEQRQIIVGQRNYFYHCYL